MKRGFSLVELSVVLVILGLLTGGILAGRSLIRAGEVKAVGNEFNRYSSALTAFREKYAALPGDMSNAIDYWGTATVCPGTSASPSLTIATCNGDGNNQLSRSVSTSNEELRFWQHMANSGLISGRYTGVSTTATATDSAASVGSNVPGSKISGAGWYALQLTSYDYTSTTYFEGNYGLVLTYGGNVSNALPTAAVFNASEAWSLDSKLDDGMPGTGGIMTYERDPGCYDGTATAAAAQAATVLYDLDNNQTLCDMLFKTLT
jgi:prepilin-type N-terminal cleavage/methylation domain-containing protein